MKNFILIIILGFIFSCSNKTLNENIIEPKEEMKQILDSFIQKNANNHYPVYELYIDKLDPDSYNMILYAGHISLTEKENGHYNQGSLVNFVYRGIKINIYSGAEHYFINRNSKRDYYLQDKNINIQSSLLAIKDSCGILSTYAINAGYPFIPLPLENKEDTFTIPIIMDNDENIQTEVIGYQ